MRYREVVSVDLSGNATTVSQPTGYAPANAMTTSPVPSPTPGDAALLGQPVVQTVTSQSWFPWVAGAVLGWLVAKA